MRIKQIVPSILIVAMLMLSACSTTTQQTTQAPATTAPVVTTQPTEATTTALSKKKVCQVTNPAGVNDKSFNQTAYKGVLDSATKFNWDSALLESKQDSDYTNNINEFLQSNCDLIVTVSYLMGDATQKAAQANPNQKFMIIDYSYDPKMDNVWGQVYATDQAAFLAGYVAASVTKTGKVGTFGGMNIPTVSIFMDGFARGVKYYNEKNGKNVEVLGWDIDKQDGLFTGNFTSTDDGRRFGENLLEEGADIILPVAGPVGLGAAAAVKAQGNAYVIGVDTDWTLSAPEYSDIILTSIVKNMDVSVLQAVEAVNDGTFGGGTYTATLANGGVGISDFHQLSSLVSSDVLTQLEQVKADIIAGKIKTSK